MPITYTPLRYPGGKSKCYALVRELLQINDALGKTYIEPFAGGAGLAIKLLLKDEVNNVILNDIDPAIYAFWYATVNMPDELCRKVYDTPITCEQWEKEKRVYELGESNALLDLAFATLFLNRTNRSGIIKGGMIGGKNQQGKYKLDARFNKKETIRKIYAIANKGSDIALYNLDGKAFLELDIVRNDQDAFLYIDPPYVNKGGQLYQNAFAIDDHRELANEVLACMNKWVVTYDVCDLVLELYGKKRHKFIELAYSVNETKKAKEFIFYSDNLSTPQEFHTNVMC